MMTRHKRTDFFAEVERIEQVLSSSWTPSGTLSTE